MAYLAVLAYLTLRRPFFWTGSNWISPKKIRFVAISGQPWSLKWPKMANLGCFSSLDTQKTNFLTGYSLSTPLKFMLGCVEVISNPILMKKAIFGS